MYLKASQIELANVKKNIRWNKCSWTIQFLLVHWDVISWFITLHCKTIHYTCYTLVGT